MTFKGKQKISIVWQNVRILKGFTIKSNLFAQIGNASFDQEWRKTGHQFI